VTVRVNDANGCQGTQVVTLQICPVITVSPTSLSNGTVGLAYTQTVTGSGGAASYNFAVSAGTLPTWATLNPSTGAITGTPNSTTTASFTIRATDASGCSGTRAFTITPVCPVITITPTTRTAYLAAAYSQPFSASGGTAPYGSWTVTSGILPAGLSLSAAGVLSGTPSAVGSSTVTVRTTDALGCQGSQSITITVKGLTLGNSIWQDNDNDGIRDAGEPGVSGVQVILMNPGADNVIGGSSADVQIGSIVTTTATGLYSFTNLAPGNYYVRVIPPAGFTQTSGTPATTDDNVDNNNDGAQPGGPGTELFSPVVNLAPGAESAADGDTDTDTNLTLDFGLWAALGVGNLVFIDFNNNGNYDDSEGIEGVYLQIFAEGANVTTDEPAGVGFSDNKGRYFIDSLNPGRYFLHLPASQFGTGAPLSGMVPMGTVVAGDDDSGQNLLTAATPATSGASTAVFALTPGALPSGVSEPGFEGIVDDAFIDVNNDMTLDLGLVSSIGTGFPLAMRERVVLPSAPATETPASEEVTPITYASWLETHGQSDDGDLYPNLLEYALDTDPADGRSGAGKFALETTLIGGADAIFTRPASGRADIRYDLETSLDGITWSKLSAAPQATIGSDGRQIIRYVGVDGASAFAGQTRGLLRLKVSLDANLDGVAEDSATAPVVMFSRETFTVGQRSFSMPLVKAELFAGKAVVAGKAVTLPVSVTLPAKAELYIEDLATGVIYEVEEAASTSTVISLQADLPASASRVALRVYHTLAELLPEDLFTAGGSAETGDRVLSFDAAANTFSVAHLSATGWQRDGLSISGQTLPPQSALLVHVRNSEATVLLTGQVTVKRLIKPESETRFLGTGSVIAESPESAGLTVSGGFRASPEAGTSSRLRLWKADAETGATGYDSLFLHQTGESSARWLRQDDSFLQDLSAETLLQPFRGFFLVP
jgi:hypothetical protein